MDPRVPVGCRVFLHGPFDPGDPTEVGVSLWGGTFVYDFVVDPVSAHTHPEVPLTEVGGPQTQSVLFMYEYREE